MDDLDDFGMMGAEDSLVDEVNPDWRDLGDDPFGRDDLFWRCSCSPDCVHPGSLSVCPVCGRERDL